MSLLEDGPLRRIIRERRKVLLAQKKEPEAVVRKWREEDVNPELIDMAIRMSDNWIKKMKK